MVPEEFRISRPFFRMNCNPRPRDFVGKKAGLGFRDFGITGLGFRGYGVASRALGAGFRGFGQKGGTTPYTPNPEPLKS